MAADDGADYDEYDEIDLSTLEPLIACPSSPDNVVPVREVAGIKVDQVIVGSSVNSSFRDLMTVCRMVEGRRVSPGVHFHVNPGSRQVLENVAQEGGVLMLLMAGSQYPSVRLSGVHRHGTGARYRSGEPAHLSA